MLCKALHNKGHVERAVEYIRRKCFAFKDDFDDRDQAQRHLDKRLSELNKRIPVGAKESPYALLQQERSALGSHPGRMECFDMLPCKVDKWSTICISNNRYSVPDHLVGRTVYVKCYSSHIQVYSDNETVCRHPRSYENFHWSIDLNHYLKTLHRKPGAVRGSVAMNQAPVWLQQLYEGHFHTNTRSFIDLLLYCKDKEISLCTLQETVNSLLKRHPHSINIDHITALLGNDISGPIEPNERQVQDAIAMQALENLGELNTMMEGPVFTSCKN